MFIISILLVPTFSIDSVFGLIRYTFGQTQRSSSCTCPIIISFFRMHWELVEQAVEEHAQIIPIPLNRTSQFIPVGRRACPGSINVPGIHVSRSHLILFRSYIHVFPFPWALLFLGASILLILILFLLLLVLIMFTSKTGIHPFHLITLCFIHFISPSMVVFIIGTS